MAPKEDSDILPLLRAASQGVTAALRPQPNDPSLAGWGQFLNAEGHKEQIGPYGTSAALLLQSIANTAATVDARVVKQIQTFWEFPITDSKLRQQNARMAFLLLALAKTGDAALKKIEQAAAQELIKRQRPDGAWADWSDPAEQTPGPPRPETTAWVILALHRSGHGKDQIKKGQTYLQNLVSSKPEDAGISRFALGVLLWTMGSTDLHRKTVLAGLAQVQVLSGSPDEAISFFDYLKPSDEAGKAKVLRDYLCYPNIFTESLLIAGLSKHGSLPVRFKTTGARVKLLAKLKTILETGHPHKLPGAAFAATVDQAMIAFSCECLFESESRFDPPLRFVTSVWGYLRENVFSHVFLPLLLVAAATVAINDTKTFVGLINMMPFAFAKTVSDWVTLNEGLSRIIAAAVLWVFANLPGNIWSWLKRRFQS
jgi:hypothetical protein